MPEIIKKPDDVSIVRPTVHTILLPVNTDEGPNIRVITYALGTDERMYAWNGSDGWWIQV